MCPIKAFHHITPPLCQVISHAVTWIESWSIQNGCHRYRKQGKGLVSLPALPVCQLGSTRGSVTFQGGKYRLYELLIEEKHSHLLPPTLVPFFLGLKYTPPISRGKIHSILIIHWTGLKVWKCLVVSWPKINRSLHLEMYEWKRHILYTHMLPKMCKQWTVDAPICDRDNKFETTQSCLWTQHSVSLPLRNKHCPLHSLLVHGYIHRTHSCPLCIWFPYIKNVWGQALSEDHSAWSHTSLFLLIWEMLDIHPR